MKTKLLTVLGLAAALPIGVAQAQTNTPAPAAPAPAATAPQAPGRTIYVPRLPAAAELTSAASAQGLTVERIEQTGSQVTASYRNSSGQTSVVAYLLLPTASAPAASTVVVPSTPAPTVVDTAPRVVYYEPDYTYYRAYDPWYWYPPVSLHLGFGYGFRGGHFRGGFHHWR